MPRALLSLFTKQPNLLTELADMIFVVTPVLPVVIHSNSEVAVGALLELTRSHPERLQCAACRCLMTLLYTERAEEVLEVSMAFQ